MLHSLRHVNDIDVPTVIPDVRGGEGEDMTCYWTKILTHILNQRHTDRGNGYRGRADNVLYSEKSA